MWSGNKRHNTRNSQLGAGATQMCVTTTTTASKYEYKFSVNGGIRTGDLLHGKQECYHWANRDLYYLSIFVSKLKKMKLKKKNLFFPVDQIFREANVTMNSKVRYEDFVKIACAPVPDYY